MDPRVATGRPWMIAFDQRLEALRVTEQMIAWSKQNELKPRWKADAEALRDAEVFDWAAVPMHACMQAAQTIPHETMSLRLGLTPPGKAGWWWFQEPMLCKTLNAGELRDDGDHVVALLWGWHLGWTDPKDADYMKKMGIPVLDARPSLGFTAFVSSRWPSDGEGGMKRVPAATTTWRWFEGETLHEMLARCVAEYQRVYGPDGAFHDTPTVGLKPTLKAVCELSMFFIAACAWLEQKILVETPGHVERHARKRAERDLKTKAASVRVIQLRRLERRDGDVEPEPGTAEHVSWSCRWVVSGHWRHQPVGQGRKERKLIYISPFVKGPDDMPLRDAARKVYEVDR